MSTGRRGIWPYLLTSLYEEKGFRFLFPTLHMSLPSPPSSQYSHPTALIRAMCLHSNDCLDIIQTHTMIYIPFPVQICIFPGVSNYLFLFAYFQHTTDQLQSPC